MLVGSLGALVLSLAPLLEAHWSTVQQRGDGLKISPTHTGTWLIHDCQGFYINLVIGGASLPILLFLVPSFDPRPPATSRRAAFASIDWLGTILSTGAFITGIMALSFAGTKYAWNSGATITLFVVSGLGFIGFWAQQHSCFRTSLARRLFPIHFYLRRDLLMIFIIQCMQFLPKILGCC